jgi:acyl-CoA dehydrogenase
MFISRVLQSDLMLLLARTTPVDHVKKKTDGLSVFLVDIRGLKGFEVRPLRMMMNHSTNALFFDNVEIPADSLIGQEGKGFSYILDGMNAERILVASDSLGDARWFTEKAVAYAGQRVIFAHQQPRRAVPDCQAHMSVEAAELMRNKAAALFDAGQPCGAEPTWRSTSSGGGGEAATPRRPRGYGFAEGTTSSGSSARRSKTAPINQNLVTAYIAEHVLGLPRSY